eukprot:scaffold15135_cov32-Tisochrysis_lutea.AAC.2
MEGDREKGNGRGSVFVCARARVCVRACVEGHGRRARGRGRETKGERDVAGSPLRATCLSSGEMVASCLARTGATTSCETVVSTSGGVPPSAIPPPAQRDPSQPLSPRLAASRRRTRHPATLAGGG